MPQSPVVDSDIIRKLLDVGVALTVEKNYDKLLEKIVTQARSITCADGGTLYLLEKDKLVHKIMQTESMNYYKGGDGQPLPFEPIKIDEKNIENISTYCAITKKIVNIKDVYHYDTFDFSGPKNFDKATGYKTKSMLVFPLISRKGEVVGVLQLINAQNREGSSIEFDEIYEEIVHSLASQAGIAIENMQYVEEIKEFFESFVRVMVKTIDERTPYNSEHSKHIALLSEQFARYINQIQEGPLKDVFFSEETLYELNTAGWLHDIGKIVIPLDILDKPTRLAQRYDGLRARHELIRTKLERNYLREVLENKKISSIEGKSEFEKDMEYMNYVEDFVDKVNNPSFFVDKETAEEIKKIQSKAFRNIEEPLLTEEETKHLSIMKGTLTKEERSIIENHVSASVRILSQMTFPNHLSHVLEWASKHHEYLDGTGYVKGCKAEELPIEVRILTVLDIYDALISRDRPYKPAIPKPRALEILRSMAKEGKLDTQLVEAFIEGKVWE